MILQLDPPLLFVYDGRRCSAIMAIDYGPEWETLFLCAFDDSRELWWLSQKVLRIRDNISMGRCPKEKQ
jgi:hypothetical protein